MISAESETSCDSIPRAAQYVPHAPNPFEYGARWACFDVLKLILLCPLAFVRFALCCLILFASAMIAGFATYGLPMRSDHGTCYHTQPLAPCRRYFLRLVVVGIRAVLWLFGFWRIRLIDGRSEESRNILVNVIAAAPHVTNIDMLVIYWIWLQLLPSVGDAKIMKVPLVGCLGKAMQNIFVNLRTKNGRQAAKNAIAMRADPTTWQGPPLLIFPEGRITNGQALIQFRTGAFEPGQPVQPVILQYPYKFFDVRGATQNNGGMPFWGLRMLTQFYNCCTVQVLDVHVPSAEERLDPIAFACNVRRTMAEALGVGTTEHSYDDASFFRAAQKARVVPEFEIRSLQKAFSLNPAVTECLLRRFRAADVDGDGSITCFEFCALVNQLYPGGFSAAARQIFVFFDTNEDGSMQFNEFVQAISLLSKKGSREDSIRLAFLMYAQASAADLFGWQPLKRGDDIPDNAVQCGATKTDGVVYVGRFSGEPGKINSDSGKMWNFWGHSRGRREHAEILTLGADASLEWRELRRGEPIPLSAVEAGSTITDGAVYVGRFKSEPGKINAGGGKMWNFWGHHSGQSKAAEILVVSSDREGMVQADDLLGKAARKSSGAPCSLTICPFCANSREPFTYSDFQRLAKAHPHVLKGVLRKGFVTRAGSLDPSTWVSVSSWEPSATSSASHASLLAADLT